MYNQALWSQRFFCECDKSNGSTPSKVHKSPSTTFQQHHGLPNVTKFMAMDPDASFGWTNKTNKNIKPLKSKWGKILSKHIDIWGFPDGASGKELTCQCMRHKTWGFDSWVRKIPWRRKWQPTPVFLPGEFCGQRSLVGYNPQARKESDVTEWLSTHQHVGPREQSVIIQQTFMSGKRFSREEAPGTPNPEWGSFSGEEAGVTFWHPLQYSCLEEYTRPTVYYRQEVGKSLTFDWSMTAFQCC